MKKLKLTWCAMAVPLFLALHACSDEPAVPLEEPDGPETPGPEAPAQPIVPGAPGTIITIAGAGAIQSTESGDGGPATAALLAWITSVAVDSAGNVYIADGAANTIRLVTASDGRINTLCGQFIGYNVVDPTPYAGDGGPALNAHVNIPLSVEVDALGAVSLIDAGNFVVRQIAPNGIITTVAGKNDMGYTGDNGPATDATFDNPYSVAADADGNLYVAEAGNNTVRRIDRATGIITTIAGLGPDDAGYTGDNGPAVDARLNGPTGIAVDAAGNIYIADTNNGVIRKISGGIITTVAGNGTVGYSGDNGPATSASFAYMHGIAVDLKGNIYVADTGNSAVRRIDAMTGIITTFAGNYGRGYSGDGGPATEAALSDPLDVAVDKAGNVYIADTGNFVVRLVAQ